MNGDVNESGLREEEEMEKKGGRGARTQTERTKLLPMDGH